VKPIQRQRRSDGVNASIQSCSPVELGGGKKKVAFGVYPHRINPRQPGSTMTVETEPSGAILRMRFLLTSLR